MEGDIAQGGGDLTVVSILPFVVTLESLVDSVTIGSAYANVDMQTIVIYDSNSFLNILSPVFYFSKGSSPSDIGESLMPPTLFRNEFVLSLFVSCISVNNLPTLRFCFSVSSSGFSSSSCVSDLSVTTFSETLTPSFIFSEISFLDSDSLSKDGGTLSTIFCARVCSYDSRSVTSSVTL